MSLKASITINNNETSKLLKYIKINKNSHTALVMCCVSDRNHRPILTTNGKTYLFQLLTTLRVAHCHRVCSYHCIFVWASSLMSC